METNEPQKQESLNNIQEPKPRKFLEQYGIILSILIGCWIIGMSIIAAGLLIVRQMGTTIAGTSTQKIDVAVTEKDPVLGRSDAPVTIIEFADFQCPFCKQFQDAVFPKIKSSYIDSGKVKFVFKNLAFLGQESLDAAESSKCAQDQGKFWEYHDLLYASQKAENSGDFSTAALKKFAGSVGLDQAKFDQCLDTHAHQADVAADADAAQGYGINSTPTILVNGIVSGDLSSPASYETAIETALTEAETAKKAGPVEWVKSLFQKK